MWISVRSVVWIPVSLALTGICFCQGAATPNLPAVPRAKPSGSPFQSSFRDVAIPAGLHARFVQGNPSRKKYIIEANGTGVAFLDFNNDGLLDVFLVNGSRFEPYPKGKEPFHHLYENRGGGKFADVTLSSGLKRSGWGNGVCSGDIDNDGNEDLYVTYWGANSLYRNKGGGRFEDVAPKAGVTAGNQTWSTGCTFLDYDRDGLLDLFVTSYVGFDLKRTPLPGEHPYCMFRDKPVFCGPRGLPYGSAKLYHNKGDGTFTDVSVQSGVAKATGFYGFTATAADLSGDGWIDIYVASDSTPSLYFRNNKNGTFSELATEAGIAYNENGTEQAGMGVAVADFNNDGFLDITKTNFIRDYPNLYRSSGKGFFEDVSVASGLAVNPQYLLWGVGLEDFDNDGRRDLLQVAGHVYPELQVTDPGESYATARLVYRQLPEGKFEDVSLQSGPGIIAEHSSRGAAFGDFDNDGDVDALVMNMDEPPSLLRNDLNNKNGWLKVKLEGTKSNRSAIGAVVTVYAASDTQTAAVLSQSSYLSVNDTRLHFGLGGAKKIDRISVRWPSGASEDFTGADVNSLVVLTEGTGAAKPLTLRK
jgi:hypothetical protein